MTKSRKIHPTVEITYLEVLEKDDISPREAIEIFAIHRATNNDGLIYEKSTLEREKKMLEDEIKTRENRLNEINKRLTAIDTSIQEYAPLDSKNHQEAIAKVMSILNEYRKEQEKKKWGRNKLTLKEIKDICQEHKANYKSVLSKIDKTFAKKWIQDYDRY